jgi:hypothetical protein
VRSREEHPLRRAGGGRMRLALRALEHIELSARCLRAETANDQAQLDRRFHVVGVVTAAAWFAAG